LRQFGKMVSLRGGQVKSVDIAEAVGQIRTVDPNGQLVLTARAIGVSFGD
jgi:hypothetical protein